MYIAPRARGGMGVVGSGKGTSGNLKVARGLRNKSPLNRQKVNHKEKKKKKKQQKQMKGEPSNAVLESLQGLQRECRL